MKQRVWKIHPDGGFAGLGSWGGAGHLIIAWVLTIPASGLLAACSFFLLNAVGFA